MGKIGTEERKTLTTSTEAGNAAAHRGWKPGPEEVSTIMDVVEAFLQRSFVLGDAITRLREIVPPKPKRKSKGGLA